MKAAKTPLILSQAARRLKVQSHFLENDLEGPTTWWERHAYQIFAHAPECFRQPFQFLGESNHNRKRRTIHSIAPIATVLFLISVNTTLSAFLRHLAKAGFDDRLPSYSCQPSGYFKGGAWTFIGIDVWVAKTSFSQAKLLDLLWIGLWGEVFNFCWVF